MLNPLLNKSLEKQNIKAKLVRERSKYASQWQITSQHYYELGYYDWMCQQLGNSKNVLEIGCGSGFSTLSLLENNKFVIAVEENLECLKNTESLLTSKDYNVKKILREMIEPLGNERYRLKYDDISSLFSLCDYDVVLIQGDLLNDEKLFNYLQKNSEQLKFDAIACWLLGTHNYRGNNIIFNLDIIKDSTEARKYLQRKIYLQAQVLLDDKGILNFIDRTIAQPELEEFFNSMHNAEELSQGTDFKIYNSDTLEYFDSESVQDRGVRMVKRSDGGNKENLNSECLNFDKKLFYSMVMKK